MSLTVHRSKQNCSTADLMLLGNNVIISSVILLDMINAQVNALSMLGQCVENKVTGAQL